MSAELTLVDSNVLIYAVYPESPQHAASRALVEQAQNGDVALCVTPQVLAEFYSVVTDPRRVTVARTVEEAADAVSRLLAMPGLQFLAMSADVVRRWLDLVRQHSVKGSAIFDVQLVATMLANGVRKIYTFNRDDFEPFEEIDVFSP
jgi:toxin-antitoxin system PIN domain toxin